MQQIKTLVHRTLPNSTNSRKAIFGLLGGALLMLASFNAMSAESSVQMLVSVEEKTKHPFNYTQLETIDLFYLDSLVSKSPSLARAILIVANRCDATPTVNAMIFIGANSKSIMNAHDGDKWRSTFEVNSDDCLHLQQINAHTNSAGTVADKAARSMMLSVAPALRDMFVKQQSAAMRDRRAP